MMMMMMMITIIIKWSHCLERQELEVCRRGRKEYDRQRVLHQDKHCDRAALVDVAVNNEHGHDGLRRRYASLDEADEAQHATAVSESWRGGCWKPFHIDEEFPKEVAHEGHDQQAAEEHEELGPQAEMEPLSLQFYTLCFLDLLLCARLQVLQIAERAGAAKHHHGNWHLCGSHLIHRHHYEAERRCVLWIGGDEERLEGRPEAQQHR
mmetsp:Transcript_100809/g.284317  ORF Transcript_100809/g.284317 Transcript_100809/m.284317 type:complete len:208 (-) Transcript_100809:1021-1644(-)